MLDRLKEPGTDASGHEELRGRLLERAVDLLEDEGASALTMRRLAEECETTTHMIYTLFGNKAGLVEEVFELGRRLVQERCQRVPDDLPPVERLYRLGRVYHEFAREHGTLYEAVYSSDATREFGWRSDLFEYFREAVEACREAGHLGEEIEPIRVTISLLAAAHGAISLELAGFFEDEKQASDHYDAAVRAAFDGYRVEDPTELPPQRDFQQLSLTDGVPTSS